jgi:hypothetical protein
MKIEIDFNWFLGLYPIYQFGIVLLFWYFLAGLIIRLFFNKCNTENKLFLWAISPLGAISWIFVFLFVLTAFIFSFGSIKAWNYLSIKELLK